MLIKYSVQQQIHFSGNIFWNKCCRCNKDSLYIYFQKSATPNVFDELVEYVRSEVPVVQIPELPKKANHSTADVDSKTDTTVEHGENISGVINNHDLNKTKNTDESQKLFSEEPVIKQNSRNVAAQSTAKPGKRFTGCWMYDKDKCAREGFDGQEFISISDNSHVIEIDEDEANLSNTSFGIAAPLIDPRYARKRKDKERYRGKKQKLGEMSKTESASGYKEISIKQLKRNPKKGKKKQLKTVLKKKH